MDVYKQNLMGLIDIGSLCKVLRNPSPKNWGPGGLSILSLKFPEFSLQMCLQVLVNKVPERKQDKGACKTCSLESKQDQVMFLNFDLKKYCVFDFLLLDFFTCFSIFDFEYFAFDFCL